jgi:hypothetical protein
MWERLQTLGHWLGGTFLLFGVGLIASEYPITVAVLVGGSVMLILGLTGWFDFEHWKRKLVLWRHADVLAVAGPAIDPHVERLARRMGEVVKWDGRSDYDFSPWAPILQEALDTAVIPSLTAEQQARIRANEPYLREEIGSQITGRAYEHAQRLGLII